MNLPPYVLVTPVRNEQETIGITIQSVIRQTVLPEEWVIVSDRSTDRTDETVHSFAAKHPFIRLVRLEGQSARSFSSVVFALEAGVSALKTKDYEFIGLLDGDIRFDEVYYEEIIRRFAADSKLGLAGGIAIDCYRGRRLRHSQSLSDVAGALQFFRRECFESLGGFVPIPEGGWDTITCLQARMHGFKTQTFPDIEVDHLKPRNVAEGGLLKRSRQMGMRAYAVGNHPLFEMLRCVRRCFDRPLIIGGLMRFAGYASCYLRRCKRILTPDIVEYVRREQMCRLFPFVKPIIGATMNRVESPKAVGTSASDPIDSG